MGFIFGGSKQQSQSTQSSQSQQQSESGNYNNPFITDTFSPIANQTKETKPLLMQLLGLGQNGMAGIGEALQGLPGYQWMQDQASKGVQGGYAGKGVFQSGAAMKALSDNSQGIADNKLNELLANLFNFSNQGLNAGQLITGAGQYSKSSGTSQSTGQSTGSGSSNNGMGSFLGSVIGAAASDRRLKENIVKVGELSDGLGLYEYNYKGTKKTIRGVMADEVQRLRPEALGPVFAGYRTVKYDKLGADYGVA